MHRHAIVVLALVSSCFRGDFLEGTSCEMDSECAPQFVCLHPDAAESGGSTGPVAPYCGPPDNSPPPGTGTSGTTGATTGSDSTGKGSTGSDSTGGDSTSSGP